MAESGVPGFGVDNWYALFLPGGTDKAIAVKIQETVAKSCSNRIRASCCSARDSMWSAARRKSSRRCMSARSRPGRRS